MAAVVEKLCSRTAARLGSSLITRKFKISHTTFKISIIINQLRLSINKNQRYCFAGKVP
jgi:hypothetical protein